MPLDLNSLMQLIAMSRAGRAPGLPTMDKAASSVVATPMGRSSLNDPHQIDPLAALQLPADMAAKQAQARLLGQQADILKQFNVNDLFGGAGGTGAPTAASAFGALGGAATTQPQTPFTSFPPPPPAAATTPSTYPSASGSVSAGGAVGGGAPGGAIDFTQARALAENAGFRGRQADTIAAIVFPESGGDPFAKNEKGEHSYGITQINADAHGPVAREALGNPQRAMELAFKVSKGGTDFTPWTTYTSGKYLQYMPNTKSPIDAAPSAAPKPATQATPPGPMMPERGDNRIKSLPPGVQAGQDRTDQAAYWSDAKYRDAVNMRDNVNPASADPTPLASMIAGAPGQAPAARGSAGAINPMALAKAQMQLAMGGIQGTPLAGVAQALYNSPEYIAQKAAAEKWAGVAPELATAQGRKQIDIRALPQELGIRQQSAYGDPANNPELQARLAGAKTMGEKHAALLTAGVDPASPQGQAILRNALPDSRPEAVRLAEAGNLQGPQRDAALQGAIPGNAPPTSVREYDAYKADQASRGEPVKSLYDWNMDQRKAGATNVSQHVEGQGQAALITHGIKMMETSQAAAMDANRRTTQLGQMANAMEGFTPGATAEMRLRTTRVLKDLGIISGENVSPQEQFAQASKQFQLHVMPKGQGAISDFERSLIAEAVPNMGNSPEALRKMIDQGIRLDNYDRKIAEIYANTLIPGSNLPDYMGATKKIMELGPPLSPDEYSALQRNHEAVTGGNRGGSAPGTPAGTAPAPPQVGEVQDGHRFLGGDPANPKAWARMPR